MSRAKRQIQNKILLNQPKRRLLMRAAKRLAFFKRRIHFFD